MGAPPRQESRSTTTTPSPSITKPIPDPDATPDPTATPTGPGPADSRNLNIKIIGAVPFARLLQEGTPAFQLQVTLTLLEEYLRAGTTTPEKKMEEQILSE
ncbi:hypothetical protein C0989_000790, partial [Termitomyces sp. Mn162]